MKSRLSKIFALIGHSAVFILLSTLTQIGGIIYIISHVINWRLGKKIPLQGVLIYLVLYGVSNKIIVPGIAPFFGREPVVHHPNIKAANLGYQLFNRNYVRPELNHLLIEIANDYPIIYLDANFPFCDGFPLLPHLSHSDGKKIDLSFIYEDQKSNAVNETKSNSGYGVFESAADNELDWTKICKEKGYFQYRLHLNHDKIRFHGCRAVRHDDHIHLQIK